MKRLLALALWLSPLFLFGQTSPLTPAPAHPQQMNTNTVYQDALTKKYYTYNGSVFLWRQLVDSIQAARMIANAGFGTGTVTSITPGYGFISHIPITTTGTLNIDTAILGNNFAKLNGGNVFVGDQTIHGNINAPDYNKGLVFAHSNITNSTDALTFNFEERNGGKFIYYGQEIFRMAGNGHSADDARVVSSVPFATKPSGISKFYSDADKRLFVGVMDGSGLVTIDTTAYFKPYTKTQADSADSRKQDTATNTLQTVTYRSRYSRNSTVIGSKTLQTATATLTTYLLSDSYGLPTGPYSAQLGSVQRLTNVLRHNLTNYSISGTTKAQLTAGDSSAVNRLYRIPTYNSSTMGYYVVWYPVNDCYNSIDTAVYRAANVTIANNLVSKGWPSNRVIWGGQTYYTVNSTNLNIPKYNYVDSTVAKTYGFIYVNTYEAGNYLHLSDGVHGNTTYNELMGERFIRAINATSGADLFVKGQLMADAATIYLPQTNSDKIAVYAIADSASTITTTNPLIRADLYSNTNSFQPVFRFGRNSGSVNSKRFTPSSAITPNGMRLGGIQWGANGGSGDLISAEIYAGVNGTPDATHVPTDINFAVQGVNTTNRQVAFSVVNNGSITAAGSVSNGTSTLVSAFNINPTITAGANNVRMRGLTVNPTFVPGSFTGTTQYSIGVGAPIVPLATKTTDLGDTTWNWNKVWTTKLGTTTSGLVISAGGANGITLQTNSSTRATLGSTGLWQWNNYTTAGVLVNDASGNITSSTAYATLVSPTFTGTVTVPTPAFSTTATTAVNQAYLPTAAPVILATITGINTKATGSTALYTVPTGKTLVVTEVRVNCTAATAITAPAQADVGVAAGSVYTNASIGITTATQGYQFPPGGVMTPPTAGQVVNFTINTAATGTSQTVTVILIGYLI